VYPELSLVPHTLRLLRLCLQLLQLHISRSALRRVSFAGLRSVRWDAEAKDLTLISRTGARYHISGATTFGVTAAVAAFVREHLDQYKNSSAPPASGVRATYTSTAAADETGTS
jgi:hypothetical protein